MSTPLSDARVSINGKFFAVGPDKFTMRGVTYGPFAPGPAGNFFADPTDTARDFALIQELGANVIRVYYVPPVWMLDLAAEQGLRVFVDIPWEKHRCFLETYEMRQAARRAVKQAAAAVQGHPAIFACSVANEIPPEIVRWHGAVPVARFIDELVGVVKSVDPNILCTFASYPPTEFLQPEKIDFVTFNVYLHARAEFESYLARLQTLADARPLVLGEFGMDSRRETEPKKCETLSWQIRAAYQAGLAGTIVFSFTDDWFRGGEQILDWEFGLTARDRTPKPSFTVVQECYRKAPHFPPEPQPKVSVVVASYNGAATLDACLSSLEDLVYPDYEIILIDDGSTDSTPEICQRHPRVRYFRQENRGLSAARNAGIAAATGVIVAFTDSDCRADRDWLHYLIGDLLGSSWAGVGGHNLLPPDDSPVAAAVMVSPGGPAHVMLTDRDAEHIPGCNMAFYKWALDDIRGFDPVFRQAGDDVDVCWRLQEQGYSIGFSPGGFVWHYRRSTIKAYLRQQAGYGRAEGILIRKHPEYFNAIGGGTWRGRIYTAARSAVVLQRPVIYHGIFGTAAFQKLYAPEPFSGLMLCTSLPYHALITLPALVLASWIPFFLPLGLASMGLSLSICALAAWQAKLAHGKRRAWSRPLVALLFFLQPIVRGWARYEHNLRAPTNRPTFQNETALNPHPWPAGFWSRNGVDRHAFLKGIQSLADTLGWQNRPDSGWNDFDISIVFNRWNESQVTTVSEDVGSGRLFIRCRVATAWSWSSWLLLASTTVLVLALPLTLGPELPWIWLGLALIPIVAFFLSDEHANQTKQISSVVDQAASKLKLEPYSGVEFAPEQIHSRR